MAIELQATYSKKLGLPNYSSHCFVVSLRTELTDLSQVEAESARLYVLLQQSVDNQVQEVGFLPDATTYGMDQGQTTSSSATSGTPQCVTKGTSDSNTIPFVSCCCPACHCVMSPIRSGPCVFFFRSNDEHGAGSGA